MTEDDKRQEEAYLHFKNMNKEELSSLLLILDDDFEILKKIIQDKINQLAE